MFVRFLKDFFTTFVDFSWPYILFLTLAVHLTIWLLFAVLYYVFNVSLHSAGNITSNETCVTGVDDFLSAFLFSMESAKTIGGC